MTIRILLLAMAAGTALAQDRDSCSTGLQRNLITPSDPLTFQSPVKGEQAASDVQAPGSAEPAAPAQPETGVADAQDQTVVYRPVVDTERTHQADFITAEQLNYLPVNRRNYLNLAALTPGVSEVTSYVSITDQPLVQAPQSGLSFGGNNGRGNVFWLDGGENYLNTGGVRPSISQEGVAEFQVARSNYSAEFGGGIGGIVNIISKSGGDGFHGDLFGFLRHSSLQARNYFAPSESGFTRSQVGGTFGGPIRKGRTRFFLSFERLQREEGAFVPIGQADRGNFSRLTPSQEALFGFLANSGSLELESLAFLGRRFLLTSNFPATVALFDSNRGIFPFSEANTQGVFRLDHRFSDNHNAFLRFNAATGGSQNSQVEGLTALSRGIVSDFTDQTLMLNDTYVVSARLVSESRFLINRSRFNAANRDRQGPTLDINGYGLFGKDWTLPSRAIEWHGQVQQNFFYGTGRHSLRFGADINPVRVGANVQTNIGGWFSFGEYLPLGALYNLFTGSPNASAAVAARLVQSGRSDLVPALNAPLTSIQAFNLGVPAFYVQGFGDPRWEGWFRRFNFFVNDVIRLGERLTLNAGLRYELEWAPPELGTDPNNIGPRVGIAWDPTGAKKTVIRAGYGVYYLRHQSQIAAAVGIESGRAYNQIQVPLTGLPGSRNPVTGQRITSADIYQALSREGVIGTRPIVEQDLAQFGIVPGPDFPYQITFLPPVNFRNGYAQQASFDIERAIRKFSVLVGYNFNRGAHLPRLRDLNLMYGPPGPLGEPALIPKNPLVSQLLIYESAANSFYHALTLQVTRRYLAHFTLDAHYTLSKSIDEATDINFLPNDSLNTRKERGLSAFDQRHRFVGSAVIDLPGSSLQPGVWRTLAGGFTLAPIVTISSGRPFNVVTGLDFNSRRPAGAGRNIGRGPAYASFDMRVSREVAFGADRQDRNGVRLEFIAEGFNILNKTNFKSLNNTVGNITVDQLPRPLVGVRGNVDEPLAFVSAFNPRQFQVALKIRF